MNITKQNNFAAEIICFILFIIGTIFISIYHEPWHDEFQAWGISKDTLYNILFTVPHYEGHPPLWHLILKCFSSFDINPEWGLRIPNLLFMYGAVFLLIFKSPFPKVLRLILPFTYFIFYQYAIVSRPYSIFCFALFLAAVFYKERNEHPYKYVSALCLLCLSCAYGMVFAAGIIAVWVIEILKEHLFSGGRTGLVDMGNKIENKKISPRIKAILLITLLCIILTAVIFPADDVYFYSGVQKTNKLLYMLFGLPCDALISNILIINSPEITSENKAASIFIYAALFFLLKYYKALLLFIVPYSLSSVLLMKYIAVHHTGLFTLFFIFIFWCALSVNTKTMKPLYKKCVCVILLIPVLIQLNWTFTASAREYNLNYWYSRETAQYIKEHHLDKYRIMSAWGGADENNFSVLQMGIPVHVNPYFHKNIFYNFNTFYPNKEYVVMKENSEYENKRAIDEWKKHELPDIFIGGPQLLQLVYDKNSTQDKDYCLLHVVKNYQIFKNYAVFLAVPIYAREDIIEEIINDGNNEEKIHC